MSTAARALVIAAPSSGAGKTTVSLGLMAALKARGLVVQPFKCGPDFIDPGHHTRVCGRPSRNIDDWMLPADVNQAILRTHSHGAHVSVVEGVMGLFDGAGATSAVGSTASVARLLDLPVVLVVDGSRMSGSAGALVHGFATFDPRVQLAGVIFNKVGSAAHYALLAAAVAGVTGVRPLGYLPHDPRLRIPERHLGLTTTDEEPLSAADLAHLAAVVERHVLIDELLALAAPVAESTPPARAQMRTVRPRIGIARDRAFCFYYQDNLDALTDAGADLVPFSPLDDATLPPHLDALYLGGGYPELWAERLSANVAMRRAVADCVVAGRPVYAECGGMMYLAEAIRTIDGARWPMVGALPMAIVMTDRLQRFGYVEATFATDCLLGPAGTVARGHSFHYSDLEPGPARPPCAYNVRYTSGRHETEGYSVGRVLASYAHLHFRSHPGLARAFVAAAAPQEPFHAVTV